MTKSNYGIVMTATFKGQVQVYAVIREDRFLSPTDLQNRVIVKEIVYSMELAQQEVDRLNQLFDSEKCYYWWQTTRLYPPHKSAGSEDAMD